LPPLAWRFRFIRLPWSEAFCREAMPSKERLWRCDFSQMPPHGPERDTTGYNGFYYDFLDRDSGRRAWDCELSSIDTALLLAGMLAAAVYYRHETADEAEIRRLLIAP